MANLALSKLYFIFIFYPLGSIQIWLDSPTIHLPFFTKKYITIFQKAKHKEHYSIASLPHSDCSRSFIDQNKDNIVFIPYPQS